VPEVLTEPNLGRRLILVVSTERLMLLRPSSALRGSQQPAADYSIRDLTYLRARSPSQRRRDPPDSGAVIQVLKGQELFIGAREPRLGGQISGRLQALLPSGLTVSREALLVGGCIYLGGSGYPLRPGIHTRIAFDGEGVHIANPEGNIVIAYADLVELELAGPGTVATDAGIVGGGFGFKGAAEGMLAASVINRVFRKRTTHTIVWIRSVSGELCFHHDIDDPDSLRLRLSPVFVRLREESKSDSVPSSPVGHELVYQLERLASLHERGLLSHDEYAAAKARLLQ
jgi:Short C-terminal domain